MLYRILRTLVSIALLLALFVVMLGAYTRLTGAGLGCPDWPGCYGKMILPSQTEALSHAQMAYPEIPIESRKAWTEMAHRYAAGTLGLLILFIGLTAAHMHHKDQSFPWHFPAILIFLVIFQALLGMWTVTLKLLPVVVMGHLLGGMMIFACLVRFRLQLSLLNTSYLPQWRFWIWFAVIIIFCQIALGGWVSANYAGIACVGFPTCNGMWWPDMHLVKGFYLFSAVGENYQGGLLENEVRMTIQIIHRLGAVLTVLYISILAIIMLMKTQLRPLKAAAGLALSLVIIQFSLGVMNVVYLLPLHVAVAHNGVAALLLATVFSMLHFTKKRSHGNAD